MARADALKYLIMDAGDPVSKLIPGGIYMLTAIGNLPASGTLYVGIVTDPEDRTKDLVVESSAIDMAKVPRAVSPIYLPAGLVIAVPVGEAWGDSGSAYLVGIG